MDAFAHYILREDRNIDIDDSYRQEGERELGYILELGIPLSDLISEWMIKLFWPFQSKYLIIELDDQYSYTVNKAPKKKKLWIMAGEKTVDVKILSQICQQLKNKEFNTTRIKRMKFN